MRIEKDSLGDFEIPDGAYYGIQSLRAARNFPISGYQVHWSLLKNYLLLKKAAALANLRVGVLDQRRAQAITNAVDDLLSADFKQHFVIDAYQAGAGTSQNMNANEVVANRANELLGGRLGSYDPIDPHDHVNMSQSTNDTYPTVLRLTAFELSGPLHQELKALGDSFKNKAVQFKSVLKAARTHLQDAVPITLGQEFFAYASVFQKLAQLTEESRQGLTELGIGGSAAGTGINVPIGFSNAIVEQLQKIFSEPRLHAADNLCAAMQSQLVVMVYSNSLRCIALELTRVLNDLRLLSSGPFNGFAEIFLPAVQPGSSIMPGKVNPSILEMANQVLFKVLGNDAAMAMAVQAGQLELNVMMPLMAQVVLESTELLTTMLQTLRLRCIDGIEANQKQCQIYAERTPAISTVLNLVIGYDKAAELTKESLLTGQSILALVRERKILSEEQIQSLMDPQKLAAS